VLSFGYVVFPFGHALSPPPRPRRRAGGGAPGLHAVHSEVSLILPGIEPRSLFIPTRGLLTIDCSGKCGGFFLKSNYVSLIIVKLPWIIEGLLVQILVGVDRVVFYFVLC
jgi:hypothetical protein